MSIVIARGKVIIMILMVYIPTTFSDRIRNYLPYEYVVIIIGGTIREDIPQHAQFSLPSPL